MNDYISLKNQLSKKEIRNAGGLILFRLILKFERASQSLTTKPKSVPPMSQTDFDIAISFLNMCYTKKITAVFPNKINVKKYQTHNAFKKIMENLNCKSLDSLLQKFLNQYSIVEFISLIKASVYSMYGHISFWDTSRVYDMSYAFDKFFTEKDGKHRSIFNLPIDSWDTSNVTTMKGMFAHCTEFNQPLQKWKVNNVQDIKGMFEGCTSFKQELHWHLPNIQMNAILLPTGFGMPYQALSQKELILTTKHTEDQIRKQVKFCIANFIVHDFHQMINKEKVQIAVKLIEKCVPKIVNGSDDVAWRGLKALPNKEEETKYIEQFGNVHLYVTINKNSSFLNDFTTKLVKRLKEVMGITPLRVAHIAVLKYFDRKQQRENTPVARLNNRLNPNVAQINIAKIFKNPTKIGTIKSFLGFHHSGCDEMIRRMQPNHQFSNSNFKKLLNGVRKLCSKEHYLPVTKKYLLKKSTKQMDYNLVHNVYNSMSNNEKQNYIHIARRAREPRMFQKGKRAIRKLLGRSTNFNKKYNNLTAKA